MAVYAAGDIAVEICGFKPGEHDGENDRKDMKVACQIYVQDCEHIDRDSDSFQDCCNHWRGVQTNLAKQILLEPKWKAAVVNVAKRLLEAKTIEFAEVIRIAEAAATRKEGDGENNIRQA